MSTTTTPQPALVTGASRGLGRELVIELLRRDCPRVYAGMRGGTPEAWVAGLSAAGVPNLDRVQPVRLDITDWEHVETAVSSIEDIGLLINNAGVAVPGGWDDERIEDALRANTCVNVYGTLAVTEAFLPMLQEHRGSAIVNIMTVWALSAAGGPYAAYAASKGLLHNLTQSLRADLLMAISGVHVAGVYAGPIDTDMTAGMIVPKADATDVARAILDCLAAGDTMIYPDDIAIQFSQSYLAPT